MIASRWMGGAQVAKTGNAKGIELMNGIVQFIVGLPGRVFGPLLGAQSDWIRYGIPAVVLTVVFFTAMRFQAATDDTVASQSNVDVRKAFRPKPNVLAPAPANPSEQSANNPPPVLASGPANEAPPQPSGASRGPGTFGQVQAAGSPEQVAARQALCNAVRFLSNRPSASRGKVVLRLAMQSYHGPGGSEAGRDAVMQAVTEYKRGAWSDEQCQSPLGTTPLRKGTIGEVMR